MDNILKQGIAIVHGHLNEALGKEEGLSAERTAVCKQCPIYTPSFGGICNSKLWLNPDTGEISNKKRDGFFKGCGCRIPAKTRLIYAHCPAGKW